MKEIIIYGSHYGSTELYAKKLSEQTHIPATPWDQITDLSTFDTIVYIGGLYAGGVLGLRKTFAKCTMQSSQKLVIVTVGLADPEDLQNQHNIRTSLHRQLPKEVYEQAKIFHLRGAIHYQKLNFGHKTMMNLLYQSVRKTPSKQQNAENRAFIETYGKQVSFIDFNALQPIIKELKQQF